MKMTAKKEKTNKTIIRVISTIGTIAGGFMFGLGIVKREPGLIICGTVIGLANMRFMGTTFEAFD